MSSYVQVPVTLLLNDRPPVLYMLVG